jgi:hypothetical protein
MYNIPFFYICTAVTDITVLQLRILTNNLKIFKIQKDETHIVLNIVTALYI